VLREYTSVPQKVLACKIEEDGTLKKVDKEWEYMHKTKAITSKMRFSASKEPKPGDYIIQQSKTDVYCCPADVFDMKYKPTGVRIG